MQISATKASVDLNHQHTYEELEYVHEYQLIMDVL